MEKKKSKVKGFIKTLVFLGLVGALIFAIYSKYTEIDGMPNSDEININTKINESYKCNILRYNVDGNASPQKDYVLFYQGYVPYMGYLDGELTELYESYSYLVKLTWNLTYENDDVEMLKQEEAYLKEKLGNHFSENIAELDKENYWMAASYNFTSENPNVTYDINFKSTDLNMNDKAFQEVIRYFGLEFAYDKEVNGFTDEAWKKHVYHYNPPFKHLLNSYSEKELC